MDIREVLGDAYHEGMTLEEVETALADIEMIPKATVDRDYTPKATANKYASEAARYRRERNAKQTDNEALEDRIKELERKDAVNSLSARFVSQGMTPNDAMAAAEAMADGDTAKYMEIQEKFLTSVKEQAVSEKLHNMSTPPGGGKTGSEGEDKDYDKLIAEAQKAGNIALVIALSNQKAAAANAKH